MAKQIIQTTEFTDDFDGTPAVGTTTFSYKGHDYEIDLSRANDREFDQIMKPYVETARKVRGTRGRSRKGYGAKHDLAAVRQWASGQGIEVSARGRVAGSVIEAYETAH